MEINQSVIMFLIIITLLSTIIYYVTSNNKPVNNITINETEISPAPASASAPAPSPSPAPAPAPAPASGTLLSSNCVGSNQWGIYADGSYGTYSNILQSNSSSCGYNPPPSADSIINNLIYFICTNNITGGNSSLAQNIVYYNSVIGNFDLNTFKANYCSPTLYNCWNGLSYSLSSSCPPSQTCSDGSVIAASDTCPISTNDSAVLSNYVTFFNALCANYRLFSEKIQSIFGTTDIFNTVISGNTLGATFKSGVNTYLRNNPSTSILYLHAYVTNWFLVNMTPSINLPPSKINTDSTGHYTGATFTISVSSSLSEQQYNDITYFFNIALTYFSNPLFNQISSMYNSSNGAQINSDIQTYYTIKSSPTNRDIYTFMKTEFAKFSITIPNATFSIDGSVFFGIEGFTDYKPFSSYKTISVYTQNFKKPSLDFGYNTNKKSIIDNNEIYFEYN